MNFQNPNILYALFALVIPIIVHLFQLRKFKKTPFTNVKFLQELVLQTRKSSQIKKWLLLVTRMLIFTCIVLAFAQPYFNKKTRINEEKETIVYLDNSFSMQAKGVNGELFKIAVQELLQHFNNDEKITVLTNTKTYKNTTLSAIKNDLIALKYSPTQLPYKTVVLKAKQLFDVKKNAVKRLLMISDFQKTNALDTSFFSTNYNANLIQVAPVSVKNVRIDSAYFSTKNTNTITLNVMLAQQSSEEKNIPISVFNNDTLISKTSVLMSKLKDIVPFDLPLNKALNLKITIDDGNLGFDNTLYITKNIPEKLQVLTIGTAENNRFLAKIFTEDEFVFTQNTPKNIAYNAFENQHLIVWNEIENPSAALVQNTNQFTENGGVVVCIPAIKINTTVYNTLVSSVFKAENTNKTRLTKINFSHPIFSQVFEKKIANFQFPTFKKHYELQNYQSVILSLENGNPLLVKKGNYYIFSAALNTDNSNIKQAPLVVPTLYNIAKSSLKSNTKYYTIGKQNHIDIAVKLNKDAVLHLTKSNFDFIPLQQIKANKVSIETEENPTQAGIYTVTNAPGNDVLLAYNYDRNESILEYYNLEKLKNKYISNSTSVAKSIEKINSMHKVSSVWKWFVIFAVAFLLIELLILKYFK